VLLRKSSYSDIYLLGLQLELEIIDAGAGARSPMEGKDQAPGPEAYRTGKEAAASVFRLTQPPAPKINGPLPLAIGYMSRMSCLICVCSTIAHPCHHHTIIVTDMDEARQPC
jgi:hypothetical protein